MRRPEVQQPQDKSSSANPIADYFWIAGLDGQELFNSYARLAGESNRPPSYGVEQTIQEDDIAGHGAFDADRSSSQQSRYRSENAFGRSSRLSDEARFSALFLNNDQSQKQPSVLNQSGQGLRKLWLKKWAQCPAVD
ncbi:hypothetical protein LPUS_06166 [Lasallia pustulata]|uniref:Uncharacterized protein n=1 Tax=Lasallia pustulata TaxID=136370 RepID=A0A1W5D0M6_9LECA|nr:hypothetical protein LPUS_06166 [Lasallia pustulata]